MRVKADFHIHTHHSPDSGSSASAILESAGKAGLEVIGITDHNTVKGALEVRNLAKGILVLIGQEVRTSEGEVIVFGPEKDIPKRMSLPDTCKMASSMGGFIIAPHPFDRCRKGIGKEIGCVMDKIDAIETLNARCFRGKANTKATWFAKENIIPAVAGSDAHFPEEIGSCFTGLEIEGKLTERAVFDAVVAGRSSVHGRRTGLKPHIRTMLHRMF